MKNNIVCKSNKNYNSFIGGAYEKGRIKNE